MPWVELPHSLIRPLLFAGLLHDDKLVLPQQVKSIIFINRKHQHKLCGVALGGWFVTGTTGFQSSLLGVRNGSYWFGFYRLLTCQTSLAKKQALELYRDRIELNCRHRGSKRTGWPETNVDLEQRRPVQVDSRFTFVRNCTTFCQNLWTGLLNVGLPMRKAKNNSLVTVFGSHLMVGSPKCDCGLRLNSHFFFMT